MTSPTRTPGQGLFLPGQVWRCRCDLFDKSSFQSPSESLGLCPSGWEGRTPRAEGGGGRHNGQHPRTPQRARLSGVGGAAHPVAWGTFTGRPGRGQWARSGAYLGAQAFPELLRPRGPPPGARTPAPHFLPATPRPPGEARPAEKLGGVATAATRAAGPGKTKGGCVRPKVRKRGAGGGRAGRRAPSRSPLFAERTATRAAQEINTSCRRSSTPRQRKAGRVGRGRPFNGVTRPGSVWGPSQECFSLCRRRPGYHL